MIGSHIITLTLEKFYSKVEDSVKGIQCSYHLLSGVQNINNTTLDMSNHVFRKTF